MHMMRFGEIKEKVQAYVPNIKAMMYEILETFSVSFVVIFLIYQFVASVEIVSGASMEPTFDSFDRILVDKLSPHIKKYSRGDIVVLIPPTEESKHYIKRIIGLPGDIIKVFDCQVYITNEAGQFILKEDYLPKSECTEGGTTVKDGRALKLNADEYIVLGDNRAHSVDSRFFGIVRPKNLLGRVVFRFWPIGKVGFI
jgi:signal peptidase I